MDRSPWNSVHKSFLTAFAITSIIAWMFLLFPASFAQAQTAQGGLRLIQSDTSRIVLELTVNEYSSQIKTIGGVRYALLTIPGLSPAAKAGEPQLPMQGTLVAIPPGAQASLKITDDDFQKSTLAAPPLPAPQQLNANDPNQTLPRYAGTVYNPDAAIYSSNQLYPRDVVRINSDSTWRSQRVLAIGLYPLQVNPLTRQVVMHRRLRIEITLTYPRGLTAQALGGAINEGAFEQVFQQSILNYDAGKNWRALTAPVNPRRTTAPPSISSPLYRVFLNSDGMYQITCGQLAAAGIALPLDLSKVRMFKQGAEMAIYSSGACNTPGDPTGMIEFFGQAVNTKYSATNVYWLTPGDGVTPGKSMLVRDGSGVGTTPTVFTDTIHMEQNRIYRPFVAIGIEDVDHWYWDWLGGGFGAKDFPFRLDRLSPVGVSAVITTHLIDNASSLYQIQTSLNGTVIENATWSSVAPREAVIPITPTLLATGVNTLTLTADKVFYFNNFDLKYPATFTAISDTLRFHQASAGTWRYSISNFSSSTLQVFDITDPFSVTRFSNLTVVPGVTNTLQFGDAITTPREYFALATTQRQTPLAITLYTPANLLSPTNGADYIAITYGAFLTETKRLTDYRAAQGMRVKLVDVQNIYDEFNDGVLDPVAIRDFLAYAYANWQGAKPQFALLVGDGNWDPKEYCLGGSTVCPGSEATPPNSTFIPAYMRMVDPYGGETASDNTFVTFNVGNNMPSLSIGRLPADSVADTKAMVDKILANEQNPPAGLWRTRVSYVSGDSYWQNGLPDPAGDFWYLSDSLINQFPKFQTERIYFDACDPIATGNPACARPYPIYPTSAGVESAITSAINNGRLIVNYIGHGSFVSWASKDPTVSPWFFAAYSTQDDITPLTNGGRTPLMLEWTCNTGIFQIPYSPGLAETNVRRANGGALASWSATGQGVTDGHDHLSTGFYNAIVNQGERRIGVAADAGKANLFAANMNLDQLDTFGLLGDPASRLQVQFPTFLPLIEK